MIMTVGARYWLSNCWRTNKINYKNRTWLDGMRQRNETYACHGCYGTSIIVLASYTAPLQQTEGTSDFKTLLEFYQ